jgi:large subunit ribosomal protein L6
MSRIGKLPVTVPAGVKAAVAGLNVSIEGPKGKLNIPFPAQVEAKVVDGTIVVAPLNNSRQAKASWGTLRSIINNAVHGVASGWERGLELQGVGFTAVLKGNVLTLATGYSHKSDVVIPSGVNCTVEKQQIKLESCDKQLVGETAATIRAICPPESYLGKGIRYAGENVRRKAGKTGAK